MNRRKSLVILSTLAVLTATALAGCASMSEKRHVATVQGNDPESRQISKLMVDLLANEPQVRLSAANELGNMRPNREPVIDALGDRLRNDPDSKVRAASADALRKIGSVNAYKELRGASKAGVAEARPVYEDITRDLRTKAANGDRDAVHTLKLLGEKHIPQS